MSLFDEWYVNDVQNLISEPDDFDTVKAFIEDQDHYQSGKGFIGPLSSEASKSTLDEKLNIIVNEGISKAFTSEGVVNEVIDRRIDGVLSKMPVWSVVPRRFHGLAPEELDDAEVKPEEKERIDEITPALRSWWRDQDVYRVMHDFAQGVSAYERCMLRLYVPKARLNENGDLKMQPTTPEEALQHIFVEVVTPDKGVVHTHRRSMYKLGIVHSTIEQESTTALGKSTTRMVDLYEVTYLQEDKIVESDDGARYHPTVQRHMLGSVGGDDDDLSVEIDLRGQLLHHEGRERRRFLTKQMIEAQLALNTASTEMRIVNDDEGFPIRVILNGLAPGKFEKDPKTDELRYVPDPAAAEIRQGSMAYLQGVEVEDEDGNVADVKDVRIGTFAAGNPQNYVKEMDRRRRSILNEGAQLFVEIMDDATSSGDARVQAMFDFFLDLAYLKREVDRAGSWLLETVWALALHFADDPGRDHDLRMEFNAKINVPYLPSPLIDAFLKLVDAGARSLETLMTDTGIDDVAAERRRIEESTAFRLKRMTDVFALVKAITDAGVTMEAALEWLSDNFREVDEDDLEALLRQDTEPPDDETTPTPPLNLPTNGTDDDEDEEEEEPVVDQG